MTSRLPVWRASALLVSPTLVAAAVTMLVPGLARALRDWLAFAPGGRNQDVDQALGVWAANARVLGFVLLAALATRERRLVRVLDVAVVVSLGANVALVGLAVGAYGAPLLPWLAHLPLEWAALAVALAGYLHARRSAPRPVVLAETAVLASALLAVAAAIEVWATPLWTP